MAIADGLGGLPCGGEAAHHAVGFVRDHARAESATATGLADLVRASHRALRQLQRREPRLTAMATTLTVVSLRKGSLAAAHCGDTRLYLAGEGGVRQLTEDHSEAQKLLNAGIISAEELLTWPRRHILESALGVAGEPTVQELTCTPRVDDWLILASDGGYCELTVPELVACDRTASDAREFIAACRGRIEARGPQDNYTMVVARVAPLRWHARWLGRYGAWSRAGGNLDPRGRGFRELGAE